MRDELSEYADDVLLHTHIHAHTNTLVHTYKHRNFLEGMISVQLASALNLVTIMHGDPYWLMDIQTDIQKGVN